MLYNKDIEYEPQTFGWRATIHRGDTEIVLAYGYRLKSDCEKEAKRMLKKYNEMEN